MAGTELIIRRGASLAELLRVAKVTGAKQVFWNARYEPATITRDRKVAEALWAAGKPDEAELVLRHAIDTAPDLRFLDRADLPGKFPSRDVMNAKIKDIPGGDNTALLRGTMMLLAGDRNGLDLLKSVADRDQAARRVFLHFIGAAFGGEEKAGAGAPPPPAGGEPAAQKPAPAAPPQPDVGGQGK